jgi:hypothetical protein
MAAPLKGFLHGKTITLDSPVPPLEGKRVQIVLLPLEDTEVQLSSEEQTVLWQDWVQRGPQGPIEDDEDPGFP